MNFNCIIISNFLRNLYFFVLGILNLYFIFFYISFLLLPFNILLFQTINRFIFNNNHSIISFLTQFFLFLFILNICKRARTRFPMCSLFNSSLTIIPGYLPIPSNNPILIHTFLNTSHTRLLFFKFLIHGYTLVPSIQYKAVITLPIRITTLTKL